MLNEFVLSSQYTKEYKALKTKELIDYIEQLTNIVLEQISVFFTRKIFGNVFVLGNLDYVKLMKQES